MPDAPTMEQKLAFADTFLHILETQAPDVAGPFRQAIVAVRAKPTRQKVDSVYHDLLDWCRDLPAGDRRMLSVMLKRTIGLSLDYFDKKRIERVATIIRRDRLRSDDEWRFIEERVQELSESAGHEEELARLNRLLAAYETKKKTA